MSLPRKWLRMLGVCLLACAVAVAFTAPTVDAKMSKAQKRAVQKRLLKKVKKNPKVVLRKGFLRKAINVDFKLPVTIRLNPYRKTGTACLTGGGNATSNGVAPANGCPTNDTASLDLGQSLGTKNINIYGKLRALVTFKDPADGGKFGDVGIEIPAENAGSFANTRTGSLTADPLELLTNPDVSGANIAAGGCSDQVYGAGAADLDNFATQTPAGISQNTVLRTEPLELGVHAPGVAPAPGIGNNTQDASETIPASGGVGNLFGGTNSTRATVNLGTSVISVLREVDQDNAFNCRQAIAGSVNTHLLAKLQGTLKIVPAVTKDGNLRIAKVFLSGVPTHVAVAACLAPFDFYANLYQSNPTVRSPFIAAAHATPCNVAVPQNWLGTGTFNSPLDALANSVGEDVVYPAVGGGAQVSLAADLSVNSLSAEVMVGIDPSI